MMQRWREGATFGIIENKLLEHSLLKHLGIPQAPIWFGAFATKTMGGFPQFDAANFSAIVGSLVKANAQANGVPFLIKTATNGGSRDVVLVHPSFGPLDLTARAAWHSAAAARLVCRFLSRPYSEWGQKFEHRGVVVQPDVTFSASFACELKVHCYFGKLGTGGLYPMRSGPRAGGNVHSDSSDVEQMLRDPLYIDFIGLPAAAPAPSIGCTPLGGKSDLRQNISQCGSIVPALERMRGQLQSIASTVAKTVGADWFRLDVFILKERQEWRLLVNEITYPSHGGGGDTSALQQAHDPEGSRSRAALTSFDMLLHDYRRLAGVQINGDVFARTLLHLTNTSAADFYHTSDYKALDHASSSTSSGGSSTPLRPCIRCTARLPALLRCPQRDLACPYCQSGAASGKHHAVRAWMRASLSSKVRIGSRRWKKHV